MERFEEEMNGPFCWIAGDKFDFAGWVIVAGHWPDNAKDHAVVTFPFGNSERVYIIPGDRLLTAFTAKNVRAVYEFRGQRTAC